MEHHPALEYSITLLTLSVLAVWSLKNFRLPPMLGYLAVGMLIGPYSLNWLHDRQTMDTLAEIGMVFLLFMLGLEFSLAKLFSMRRIVFGLGLSQVFISSLSGGLLAWSFGISWQAALVVGGILALSSTAIVIRQLGDQLETKTQHGQLSVAILLFQDLAVIPLLVAIPLLADGSLDQLFSPLISATGKGIAAFAIMYIMGHTLLRPYFHLLAAVRSTELFTLGTLLVALTAAWLTGHFGLSMALGAFLAGILLSETEYRQQIELDVQPFRDILMGVFFISVGAQCNWHIFIEEWFWISMLTSGLIFGKGAVIAILAHSFGYKPATALRTGMILGQGSEFGFAILVVALQNHVLSPHESQMIIACIVLSMIIAPVLIRFNQPLADMVTRKNAEPEPEETERSLETVGEAVQDHVLICGFGRIGQNLARFLRLHEITHIALDLDHQRTREAWKAGETVFYGDSTNINVLRKAGLNHAHAVVITFDDAEIAERIILATRSIHKEVSIIVRSGHEKNMKTFSSAGADLVIPEDFEVSMMLARHTLEQLGMASEDAIMAVETARADEHQRLLGVFRGEDEANNTTIGMSTFQLNTVVITEDSYAKGKTLSELELGSRWNVTISSMRKGKQKIDQPTEDLKLEAKDVLVLQGTMDGLQNARRHLLMG